MQYPLGFYAVQSNWTAPESFPDLSGAPMIAVDIESRDPNLKKFGPGFVREDADVVGVAVATPDGFSGYYPVRHQGGGNLAPNRVFSWLRDQLKSDIPKVGSNILYDAEGLASEGVEMGGPWYDICGIEALLDEHRKRYGLPALALKYEGQEKNETLLKEAAHSYRIDPKSELYKLPAKFVGAYADEDALLPLKIFEAQRKVLEKEDLLDIFELETQVLPVLLKMRQAGVRVDIDQAEILSKQISVKEKKLLDDLRQECGRHVNPWAPKDLVAAFQRLKLHINRTARGNPSFTRDYLDSVDHPFVKKVVEYRRVNKMKRDFVEGVILKMSVNGRLYTTFSPLRSDDGGTVSGRFSSKLPNLQQIPARDEYWGLLIRSLFIAEHGMWWNKADYSQQEPRLLLHYANKRKHPGAAAALRQFVENPDTDYHQMVAEMAKCQRRQAKIVNLGVTYGMGKTSLAAELEMSLEKAVEFLEKYHVRVPYARAMARDCMTHAGRRGWIRTLLGRKCRFPLWESAKFDSEPGKPRTLEEARKKWPHDTLRRAELMKALNRLIQGSGADVNKKAMVEVAKRTDIILHLTVHDELDFSCDSEKAEKEVKETMETCCDTDIPMLVDVSRGPSWGEQENV